MKPILFALLTDDDELLPGFGPLTPAMKEGLIVLGALLFVIGAILLWVFVLRRRKRRTSDHHHRHRRRKSAVKSAAEGVSEIKEMIRERQHRHRREHRPRNPTLAETGGLPPPRSNDESSPPASQTQT